MATADDGELLARSNVVMDGYWNQPEATATAIVDGWFHTGDGGDVDDEHVRDDLRPLKDVIISGGENVRRSRSRTSCSSTRPSPRSRSSACLDEKWGELVTALVVLPPGSDVSAAELVAFCGRLAGYKCPTRWSLRPELARTATGELQKFSSASRTGPVRSARSLSMRRSATRSSTRHSWAQPRSTMDRPPPTSRTAVIAGRYRSSTAARGGWVPVALEPSLQPDEDQAGSRQHAGHAEAVEADEHDAEPRPVEGDGAEQHDQREGVEPDRRATPMTTSHPRRMGSWACRWSSP